MHQLFINPDKGVFKMAVVLAILIAGWLIAFSLGLQVGFGNEATVATQQSPVAKAATAKSSNYRDPVSAA